MNQTKSIWLHLMLLVTLVHIFSQGLVMVHYKLHKKFIIENLCENRTKPKMNCNGKCHLKKTLKQVSGTKEKSSSLTFECSQYVVGDIHCSITRNLHVIKNQYPSPQSQHKSIGYIANIFHPPLC